MTMVRNRTFGRVVQWATRQASEATISSDAVPFGSNRTGGRLCLLVVLSALVVFWESSMEGIGLGSSRDLTLTQADANNFLRPAHQRSASNTASLEVTDPVQHGVQPRAFPLWNPGTPLPCKALEGGSQWNQLSVQRRKAATGLLFVKPAKAGSTTAASVTLRIASRLATKRRQSQNNRNQNNPSSPLLCKNRVQHAYTYKMGYDRRDRKKSVLWSVLRDPTSRAISQFFHFHVSRQGKNATDEAFQKYLEDLDRDRPMKNFLLSYLSFSGFHPDADPIDGFGKDTDPIAEINRILQDYDFIGVSERMDESVVALQMILGLETADVLHISAKGSGSYDDGVFREQCFFIQKSFVSPGMESYFQSEYWKRVTFYDRLFHQAVNRSLDLTIQALGPEAFRDNLAKYRTLQDKVATECLPTIRMPCDENGVKRENTSCIFDDMGCGFECMDRVVAAMT